MDVILVAAFFFFFRFSNLQTVGCTIVEPGELSGTTGGEASFKWNSTKDDIVEVFWGLCKNNSKTISSRFISADQLDGGNVDFMYGYLNSSRYQGRVEFLGDIKKGHAWFAIKNLDLDDAGSYCALLTEGPPGSGSSPIESKVILNVQEPTTTSPPITTTNASSTPTATPTPTTCTPEEPATQRPCEKCLTTGAIFGIVIAALIVGAILGGLIVYCCIKHKYKKSSGQNCGNSDVALKNKVDKEGNDNTQPTA